MVKLIFIAGYFVLSLGLLISYLRVKTLKQSVVGNPPIEFKLWIFGKFSVLLPSLFIILKVLGIKVSMIHSPWWLESIAVIFFMEACIIIFTALISLGESTRVGLPSGNTTKLRTNGIYGFSRNPVYLGLIILALSSNFYAPNLVNFSFTIIGVFIQHKIILGEEAFLSANFGDEWVNYHKKVRRYI